MSKSPIRFGVAAFATMLLVAGPVPAAQADPVLGATCTIGVFAVHFDPGVKLITPQNVTSETEYRVTNCVSATEPLLSSATADYQLSLPNLTCVNLVNALTATFTFQWDTGQESEVQVTNIPTAVGAEAVGTVQSGLFAGRPVVISLATFPVTAPVDCLTDGLKLTVGAATLEIL